MGGALTKIAGEDDQSAFSRKVIPFFALAVVVAIVLAWDDLLLFLARVLVLGRLGPELSQKRGSLLKKSERWSEAAPGGAPKPRFAPIRAVVGPVSGREGPAEGVFQQAAVSVAPILDPVRHGRAPKSGAGVARRGQPVGKRPWVAPRNPSSGLIEARIRGPGPRSGHPWRSISDFFDRLGRHRNR